MVIIVLYHALCCFIQELNVDWFVLMTCFVCLLCLFADAIGQRALMKQAMVHLLYQLLLLALQVEQFTPCEFHVCQHVCHVCLPKGSQCTSFEEHGRRTNLYEHCCKEQTKAGRGRK